MKKIIGLTAILFAMTSITFAQENENNEHINVPVVVKTALKQKYPEAKNVGWEKENGNYEANWGGKSGEDIEIVKAIPVNKLPENVIIYVNTHYKGSKITEAGRVTDAQGKLSYEAEVKGKDVIFDEDGKFVRSEK
jgi:hypothetical protein